MCNFPNLHKNSADFKEAINRCSEITGIDPSMIEKDYWVTWCIQYLYTYSKWKDHIGFKGGTCLSKVYNLISRFSEDVDVLLDWRLLGYEQNEPMEPTTKTKKDKMKKDMNERTISYLANTMLPQMQKDIQNLLDNSFRLFISEDDNLSIQFEYPQQFARSQALRDTVKLEIGPMSQWSQLTNKSITSLLDENFPELNIFGEITVLSVSVERTFWDKISIIQDISHLHDKDSAKPLKDRQSRHFYDVYQILKSMYKDSAIEQSSLFFDVMNFSARFYPVNTFDYQEVSLSNFRLKIPEDIFEELCKDYDNMKTMLYNNPPSFDSIYKEILDFEEFMHVRDNEKEAKCHLSFTEQIESAQKRASITSFPKKQNEKDNTR